MMPETLAIGTMVYVPSIEHKQFKVQCPDCCGEHKWIISTPGGLKQEIECPRCAGGKHGYDWMLPVRYERTILIREGTITEASVRQRKSHNSDDVHEHISYDTAPYLGSLTPSKVFLTREAAEAAGAEMLIADEKRAQAEWDKERERNAARASLDILTAFKQKADERATALAAKIERLRDAMMDAVKYPSLHGPKIRRRSYGDAELTPQAIAEWLGKMLEEAGIEGFSEDEIREATCDCA